VDLFLSGVAPWVLVQAVFLVLVMTIGFLKLRALKKQSDHKDHAATEKERVR